MLLKVALKHRVHTNNIMTASYAKVAIVPAQLIKYVCIEYTSNWLGFKFRIFMAIGIN